MIKGLFRDRVNNNYIFIRGFHIYIIRDKEVKLLSSVFQYQYIVTYVLEDKLIIVYHSRLNEKGFSLTYHRMKGIPMDIIGLLYSKKEKKQKKAIEFLETYKNAEAY